MRALTSPLRLARSITVRGSLSSISSHSAEVVTLREAGVSTWKRACRHQQGHRIWGFHRQIINSRNWWIKERGHMRYHSQSYRQVHIIFIKIKYTLPSHRCKYPATPETASSPLTRLRSGSIRRETAISSISRASSWTYNADLTS